MPKSDSQRIIDLPYQQTSSSPLVATNTVQVAGTTNHNSLTGLTVGDPHTQYLPVSGSRAMTGDLDLGGNDLVNVGTIDGVAPDDAQYVVLATDATLSAERVLVAGNGLTLTDGGAGGNATVAVGAGNGISVAADSVALASSVAGAGLTFSTGVINVGAGDGISVAADSVAVNEAFTFNWTGAHTFAADVNFDSGTLFVDVSENSVGIATASPGYNLDVNGDYRIGTNGASSWQILSYNHTATDAYNVNQYTAVTAPHLYLTNENGTSQQALILGDGPSTSTVFGFSTSLDSGSTWTPRFVIDGAGNVGIATNDPAAPLHVVGDVRVDGDLDFVGAQSITTTTGNLTIDPAGNVNFPNAQTLGATTFDSSFPIQGWRISEPISGLSNLTIGQIQADELSVKIFVADETRVDRGDEYWAKSYGIVAEEFTTPGSIAGTVTVTFEDSPAITGAIFSNNDWLLFRLVDNTGGGFTASNIWGQVSGYTDLSGADEGKQSWTFTLRSGATSEDVGKGAMAISFGASGQAVIHLSTVDNSGAPYIKMRRWAGANPYTPANFTTYVQIGNLDNISNSYVTPSGDGLYIRSTGAEASYIVADDNGLQLRGADLSLYDGANRTIWMRSDGDVNFGANVISISSDGLAFDSGTGDLRIGASAGPNVKWDQSESAITLLDADLQMYDGANRTIWMRSDGDVNFGANVTAISSDGLAFDSGTGDLRIGASTGQRVLWDQSAGALKVYGAVEIQAESNFNGGYLRVGTGTKNSTLDGWVMDSGEIVGQLNGADQVVLNTSGQIVAGSGAVTLDVDGVTLDAGTSDATSYTTARALTVVESSNDAMAIFSNVFQSAVYARVQAPARTGYTSNLFLESKSTGGDTARVAMEASQSAGTTHTITVDHDGITIGNVPASEVTVNGTVTIQDTMLFSDTSNQTYQAKFNRGTTESGYVGSFSDSLYLGAGSYYNGSWTLDDAGSAPAYIQLRGDNGSIVMRTNTAGNATPSNRMIIDSSGNVDIIGGTLSVNGDIELTTGDKIGLLTSEDSIAFSSSTGITIRSETLTIVDDSDGSTVFSWDLTGSTFGWNGNNLDTEGGDLLMGAGSLRMENGPIYDASIVSFDERTTTPGVAADVANLYVKADKLIVAWQDGATTRYKYLTLTGTGTTWTHTTTAP